MTARLSVVDEIFLRTHRGLGTPIVLQGVWRTAERVPVGVLWALREGLRTGELGRRVRAPGVPGARRAWVRNVRGLPLVLYGVIPVAGLLDWADARGAELDPSRGPGWRLAYAPLADGGAVVSLTCSHVLADGRALVLAADRALRGVAGEVAALPLDPRADWADARRQWGVVLGGTARAWWNRVRTEIARDAGPAVEASGSAHRANDPAPPAVDARPRSAEAVARQPIAVLPRTAGLVPLPTADDLPREPGAAARRPAETLARNALPADRRAPRLRTSPAGTGNATVTLVAQSPSQTWDSIATNSGGTPNSLFVAVIAHTLWELGYQPDELTASLPVDTRAEPRVDNDLAVTAVRISRSDTPKELREKARAAYEYRMTSPAGIPEEILQVIPDRLAHTLAAGAGERDILCSNIGPLPDSIGALGPSRCTGMAARAIHPGLRRDRLPRTRLAGYLCHLGGEYTLALVSLEPERSRAELSAALLRAAEPFGLPLTPW
ncbi:hypothetical protein [Nocardia asteroides]|uniref:hypothetical protein n=1 Tax=Nocardia asteroides TaxID=1824 RepID=UPI001E65176B|nr:hypothetical protein [Nocardia asteroides]UGT64481.1 hypothetical protein LTT61_14855 [Nocardia asteroides]